jgi:hypothetical protein
MTSVEEGSMGRGGSETVLLCSAGTLWLGSVGVDSHSPSIVPLVGQFVEPTAGLETLLGCTPVTCGLTLLVEATDPRRVEDRGGEPMGPFLFPRRTIAISGGDHK